MADSDIQALLDPNSNGTRITIRKSGIVGTIQEFYCTGGVVDPGVGRWTRTTLADSDATKAAAITSNMVYVV
jgi:hypothetical protein